MIENMAPALWALLVLAGIWSFGEMVSIRTRALFSTVFVSLTILVLGTWTEVIPTDILDQTGILGFAALSIPLILAHMGSTVSAAQMKEEWKTIVVTLGGLAFLAPAMLTIGHITIGREMALCGSPTIFGGGVAALVLTDVIKTAEIVNGNIVIGYVWMMVAVQLFIGIPIALFCLKRFASKIVASNDFKSLIEKSDEDKVAKNSHKCIIPEKYQFSFLLIFFAILLGLGGEFLGQYTNKYLFLHPYVLTLLFGFAAAEMNLIPRDLLTKANAYGLLVLAMFLFIGHLIVGVLTLEAVKVLLVPVVLSFVIGVPALVVGAIIVGRFIKMDAHLAAALAVACMIGFPSTILVAEEVSKAVGRNKEEVEILTAFLVPKMLIAGLFTVSFMSGIVASLLGGFI